MADAESIAQAATTHETKGEVDPLPRTKMVEAYGLRKCPKLVEQCAEGNLGVRVNALAVLCEEFHNPYSIHGCVEAGVIGLLLSFLTDDQLPTRQLASTALALATADSIGRTALIESGDVGMVIPALDDLDNDTRYNCYRALRNTSMVTPGVTALVGAEYTALMVRKVGLEANSIKPLVLEILYNLSKDDRGLVNALDAGGVAACIEVLEHQHAAVRQAAANTLSFLCFSEQAKVDAIAGGAVPALISLLRDETMRVRAAATAALMAITTNDDGKKLMVDAVGPLGMLLADESMAVRVNALKVIANSSVFPPVRSAFRADEACCASLEELCKSEDRLVKTHAGIAKDAVEWEP